MALFFRVHLDLQMAIFDTLDFADRSRLACVNRAFRRFCAQHATCMRQHTEVVVPVEAWDPYVVGVSRWLAWNAIALRTVHVRFEGDALVEPQLPVMFEEMVRNFLITLVESKHLQASDVDPIVTWTFGDMLPDRAFTGPACMLEGLKIIRSGLKTYKEDTLQAVLQYLKRLASAQAAALPQLCSQLTLAKGLRELVLELSGRAGHAVPAKLGRLGLLTQLDSLQLDGISNRAKGEHLSAALRPLTRLTRLSLRFINDDVLDDAADEEFGNEDRRTVVPWAGAVCRLTNLRQLCMAADIDPDYVYGATVRGALPAALSRLTALRQLTVLGMDTCQLHRDSDQPLLPALPALESAALQLHTLSNVFPGLGRQDQVVLSRVVSLSLALRYMTASSGLYDSTELPVIAAPALTELTLGGMWLPPRWQALECSKLGWLADLPSLRRLVVKDLQTDVREIPQGITACSGLTELALENVVVGPSDESDSEDLDYPYLLRKLPASDPYLSKLVRLSLRQNAFSAVPSSLTAATALEVLDLGKQKLIDYEEDPGEPVRGLDVLDGLTRLRCVNLEGFDENGVDLQRFHMAHPAVHVNT